jgi:hypothetical protein
MKDSVPFLLLLSAAIALLAGGLVADRHLSINPGWIPLAIGLLLSALGGVSLQRKRRKALERYWERACTGIRWRRRFPDSTASQIREFLQIFVDAFMFREKRRLCFSPEDKVMEVYRACYPDRLLADAMELETLASSLRRTYGIDVTSFWKDDITLGELFAHTRDQ